MTIRDEWEELVSDWESSGKTQRRFCSERGISSSKLSYWNRKLRANGEPKPAFRKVSLGNSSSYFELVSPSGTTVRVPEGFHAESLKRLLDVLR